jgi:hypothetical protein
MIDRAANGSFQAPLSASQMPTGRKSAVTFASERGSIRMAPIDRVEKSSF